MNPAQGVRSQNREPGYDVLVAMHWEDGSAQTRQSPRVAVASDGNAYWVKPHGVHGLISELVAGRLAERLGVGPPVAVLEIPAFVAEMIEGGARFEGVAFGSRDVAGAVNGRNVERLGVPADKLGARLDGRQRALQVAFHSWLGMGDAQVLVEATSGLVLSIDHEEWAADRGGAGAMTVVAVGFAGLPADLGREADAVAAACDAIEGLTDDDLTEAVSFVPTSHEWLDGDDAERLWRMAEALAERRELLRGVMAQWLNG